MEGMPVNLLLSQCVCVVFKVDFPNPMEGLPAKPVVVVSRPKILIPIQGMLKSSISLLWMGCLLDTVRDSQTKDTNPPAGDAYKFELIIVDGMPVGYCKCALCEKKQAQIFLHLSNSTTS